MDLPNNCYKWMVDNKTKYESHQTNQWHDVILRAASYLLLVTGYLLLAQVSYSFADRKWLLVTGSSVTGSSVLQSTTLHLCIRLAMSTSSTSVVATTKADVSISSVGGTVGAVGTVDIDQPKDGLSEEERHQFNNRIPTEDEMKKWLAHDNLWLPKPTISHRFPNCPPGVIWKILMDTYVRDANSTHAFYLETGDEGGKMRLHWRAPENDRDESSLREQYKKSVKQFGFTEEGRSRVVLYPFPGRNHPSMRHIMAAAHVLEALYDADLEEGSVNANVQVSISAGLKGAIDLKENVPADVLQEFVDRMNLHSTGSGFNPQQLCSRRETLAQRWKEHKDDEHISTTTSGGNAGYEALHKSWLKSESGDKLFQHDWPLYDKLGCFLSSIRTSGRHTWFMKLLSEGFNNVSRTVSLRTIFMNCYHVDITLRKHFSESIPPERYELLWREAIKSCMPILPNFAGKHTFLIQTDVETEAIEQIKLLASEMANGKQIRLKRKLAKLSAEEKKAIAEAKKKARQAKVEADKAAKKAKDAAKRKAAKGELSSRPSKKAKGPLAESFAKGAVEPEAANAQEQEQEEQEAKAEEESGQAAAQAVETIQQHDLKDMQFCEDISDILDLASAEITARGACVDAIEPEIVSSVTRQSLCLLWSKRAHFPESDDTSEIHIWSALKQVIFKHVSTVSREWAQKFDGMNKSQIASEERAHMNSLGIVNLSDLRNFVAQNVRPLMHSQLLSLLPVFRHAREDVALTLTSKTDEEVEGKKFLMVLCDASVAAIDRQLKPEWVNMLVPYVDGNATTVSGEIAAVFGKSSAADAETLTPADIEENVMLATLRLRSTVVLQLIYEFSQANTICSLSSNIKDFIDDKFITQIAAEEVNFAVPRARSQFYHYFWMHAKSAASFADLCGAVETAACLTNGKALPENKDCAALANVPSGSDSQQSAGSSHVESTTMNVDSVVDINDNETSEKWVRRFSTVSQGLKSQDAWDATYLYVHLKEYYYKHGLNTWDWTGAVFAYSSSTTQIACTEKIDASMCMPFFGSIALSRDNGKDLKGFRLQVAEYKGISFFLTPDPVCQLF